MKIRNITVFIILTGSIFRLLSSSAVWGSKLAQNPKASGVIIMAAAVVKEVSKTDNAVFPFDKCTMKLETDPPGQTDIKIIPSAREGYGSSKRISTRLSTGR